MMIHAFSLSISILTLLGIMRFGHGLGDGLICILSIIISVTLVIATIVVSHLVKKIILLISIVWMIMLLLKATVLRGPESVWNGTIFFI